MAQCINPFTLSEEKGGHQVPCGKCETCRARQVSSWSFRLMQHYKKCSSAYFLTFTYDTQHVPITPHGYMSLCKRDIQLFFKRLRKAHNGSGKTQIKYYAVGEYGSHTKRPHYHVILFNSHIDKIQPAWKLGAIHYGTVNEASCGYTLKYMFKKGQIPAHKNDDRIVEFALMSKDLGSVTSTMKHLKSGTLQTP